jgi:hypothetical protein
MNVYQIALPASHDHTHFALPFGSQEVAKWVERALDLAGGYTYLGQRLGAWRDDMGVVHTEQMHWYEVACDRETWNLLVHLAFDLFPNEQAIYTAHVGVCDIIARPKISGGE